MYLLQLEEKALPSFAFSSGIFYDLSENTNFIPFIGYVGGGDIDINNGKIYIGIEDGPPHIKIFEENTLKEVGSFYAYSPDFLGGINISANDEKISVGTNKGAPHYKEFSLAGEELVSIYVGNPLSTNGISVLAKEKDGQITDFQSNPASNNVLNIGFGPDFPKHIQSQVLIYVSNYLSEFNINVTNTSPAYSASSSYFVLVGGSRTDYSFNFNVPLTARGVSDPLAQFKSGDFNTNTAYVFAKDLNYDSIKVANSIVHEFIHQLGVINHSSDPLSIFSSNVINFISYIDNQTKNFIRNRLDD